MRTSPLTVPPARPWRGLGCVLLLATLLLGVVTMHAMSGSSSHHGGAVVVSQHEAAAPAGSSPSPAAGSHGEADGTTAASADASSADLGAMCLMVLLTLVALPLPRGVLVAAGRALSRRCAPARPRTRARTAPCLHALGISRT